MSIGGGALEKCENFIHPDDYIQLIWPLGAWLWMRNVSTPDDQWTPDASNKNLWTGDQILSAK